MDPKKTRYPVLFTYRDILVGNGLVAGVEMKGQFLVEEEDKEVWVSGVTPGGIATGGTDPKAATLAGSIWEVGKLLEG